MRRLSILAFLLFSACQSTVNTTVDNTVVYNPNLDKDISLSDSYKQFKEIMFACNRKAFDNIPKDIRYQSTPIYTTPITTQCYSGTCYTSGGQVFGGDITSYDNNNEIRIAYQKLCWSRQGWYEVELPFCKKSQIPDGYVIEKVWTDRRGKKQKRYTPRDYKPDWVVPIDGSCIIKNVAGAWLLPHEQRS